jgi:hypothetical protein
VLLVDAANVVGSRPTGWWKDRAGAAERFVEQVRASNSSGGLARPVIVVLEGQARRGVGEGVADGVEVVHAAGEGDDTLADIAAAAPGPLTLVTADRQLANRVRRSGVEVVGPTWLLDRLDASR